MPTPWHENKNYDHVHYIIIKNFTVSPAPVITEGILINAPGRLLE